MCHADRLLIKQLTLVPFKSMTEIRGRGGEESEAEAQAQAELEAEAKAEAEAEAETEAESEAEAEENAQERRGGCSARDGDCTNACARATAPERT